ncbi:amidohydrolase family protein [Homoserinimonas sp. OAct 916]|uniref:amidohydrolase family protein n=1 Tax=Homoserinimonas sp. OAct 916 TaxID=2211450 RepID=UPI000DBE8825|nr:amidohydrolase family protein [Homoserinimonas sp. OAct 916]
MAGARIESAEPATASTRADRRLHGAVFPGIADAHVHLGLIDPAVLLGRGVSWVRDLGGDPHQIAAWSAADAPTWPSVHFAGSYLTCADGYPSDRVWAPAASIRLVNGPEHAARCVAEQVVVGASVIKVMLNSDAGPTPDLETVRAIAVAAHAAGVTVVAHAQGAGEPEKALAAGVDELAHTPWTTELPDDVLGAMAGRMSWVSTLDIHGWGQRDDDFGRAASNARRFVAAGGRLRYGTDLGNGPLPVGVNERELLALTDIGLAADDVARSSFATNAARRPMMILASRPNDPAEFVRWLTQASPLTELSGSFAPQV